MSAASSSIANTPPATLAPARFYFAFDTEGSSPLEVALAAVRDGRICNALQLILRPTPGHDEAYAIANVHGISLTVATAVGVPLECALSAMRCFLLGERANVTPDPEAGVYLFCSGEAPGAGDTGIFAKLALPWLRLRAVPQDPWLTRVQAAYFRSVTDPCVPVCPGFIHAAYAPRQLRAKAARNGTARAKLAVGYHCASHDVVRLVNFIGEKRRKAELVSFIAERRKSEALQAAEQEKQGEAASKSSAATCSVA